MRILIQMILKKKIEGKNIVDENKNEKDMKEEINEISNTEANNFKFLIFLLVVKVILFKTKISRQF